MQLKISWADLPSEVIPHYPNDSAQDLDVISLGVTETLVENMPMEILDLDPAKILISSLLSSKLLGRGIDQLDDMRWGGKYHSGDLSSNVSETLTYAMLERKFGVNLLDVIPLRSVKYLSYSPDAVIEIDRYPKLVSFLNGKGFLFLNSRGTHKWSLNWLVRNLKRDLIRIEKVRFPDNFAILTYLVREKEWEMMAVVIRP
ncbi:MAG: hypothetical protein QW699_04020 [Metallosphaera sp.]